MVKDRLADLIKARDGRGGQQSENGETTVTIEDNKNNSTANQLRKTFERADVIGQWIETIEQNLGAIRQYILKIDNITINQKDLNDKIESLFQNNTSISHKINGKLKEFDEEIKTIDTTSAEGRIKSIQYNTLKTRYQKVFKQNNAELEHFKTIKKQQLEGQLRAKGVRVDDEELTRLLDENADIQLFTDNIIAETAEAKRMLQDLEERHQQLLKIEHMLEEVRDLFLQMSILIDNQQELVDRVEYQADAAQNFVLRGRKDLRLGEQKKRKYLKRKIIMITIAITVLALILVIVFKA